MKLLTALILILAVLPGPAEAQTLVDDVFVGAGYGGNGGTFVRIGMRNDFEGALFRSGVGYLSGYAEAALLHWSNDDERRWGGVLAPVAAYYFGSESRSVRPYIGGGIGLTWLSETRIGERRLSTHLQFEDRIGIGLASDRIDAYLAFVHYSNGSIMQPNDGVEELLLTIGWSLQ